MASLTALTACCKSQSYLDLAWIWSRIWSPGPGHEFYVCRSAYRYAHVTPMTCQSAFSSTCVGLASLKGCGQLHVQRAVAGTLSRFCWIRWLGVRQPLCPLSTCQLPRLRRKHATARPPLGTHPDGQEGVALNKEYDCQGHRGGLRNKRNRSQG